MQPVPPIIPPMTESMPSAHPAPAPPIVPPTPPNFGPSPRDRTPAGRPIRQGKAAVPRSSRQGFRAATGLFPPHSCIGARHCEACCRLPAKQQPGRAGSWWLPTAVGVFREPSTRHRAVRRVVRTDPMQVGPADAEDTASDFHRAESALLDHAPDCDSADAEETRSVGHGHEQWSLGFGRPGSWSVAIQRACDHVTDIRRDRLVAA